LQSALFASRQELVLLLFKVEDVDGHRARVAYDDSPARVGDYAVRAHQAAPFRLACNDVHEPLPERALGIDFFFVADGAHEIQPPPTFQSQHRKWLWLCFFFGILVGRDAERQRRCDQHNHQDV
jgi:hypothetical protein